jgi:1-acyl-sn-glycerol-3-phosphate acyltransferase
MTSLSLLRRSRGTLSRVLDTMADFVVDAEIAAAIRALPRSLNLNELGYDAWGFSPEAATHYYSALAKPIYRYFHPLIDGIEKLPRGRVLLVSNHSGQLPFDAVVIATACLLEAKPPRLARPMVERWVPTLPWINIAFSRSGVVLGDPINCRNLLEADNAILVFPEGTKGSGKTWWHRYQLAPFGRGFVRLALQTHSPIVPVGVIGAEEALTSLIDVKPLATLLNFPYLPVPPLLPLLGPLAFVPLPTRFHIRFGDPIWLEGPFDDEDDVIGEKAKLVQKAVQELIDIGRRQRSSIF